eukprot:NODE_213_length_14376_cov_0.499054.p1 type:complete len:976 gc:universal NODE_213_length_14376_cov_0.499054:10241-7314(-)
MLEISLDPIDQRRLFLLSFLLIWLVKCIYLFSALNGLNERNYTALFVTLDTIYFSMLYFVKIPILYTGTAFQPLNIKITSASILLYGILFNLGISHYANNMPSVEATLDLPTTVYNPRGQLVSNSNPTSFYGNIHGEYLVTLHSPSFAVLTKKCGMLSVNINGHGPWNVNISINHQAINKSSNLPIKTLKYHNIQNQFDLPLNSSFDYGLFNIDIIDRLNLKGKSNSTVMVPCPVAIIKPQKYLCQNSPASFNLDINGAHPVKYSLFINNELLSGTTLSGNKQLVYNQSTSIPIDTTIPSALSINLDSLTDSHNNSIRYHRGHLGPSSQLIIHPLPLLSFKPNNPTLLRINQSDPLIIQLQATGSPPFSVSYSINDKSQVIDSESKFISIPIKTPGTLSLNSINDMHCSGKVQLPNQLPITLQPPPSVLFTPNPIKDACFGQTALDLNTSFTGILPFTLYYTESVNDKTTQHSMTITKYRKSIKLEPTTTGLYTYTMKSFSDAVYPSIDINQSFTIQSNPLSKAHFESNSITVCVNTPTAIPIIATGQSPWSITMNVVSNHDLITRQILLSKIISPYQFELNLSNVGQYSYELATITDVNQCTLNLDDKLLVNVVNTNPWVEFDSPSNILMPEGSTIEIPIIFSSTAIQPFSVQLKHNNVIKTITNINSHSSHIMVSESGTYELVSANDKYCAGTVPSDLVVSVDYYTKPSVTVHDYSNIICQSTLDTIKLELNGSGIFKLIIKTFKDNKLLNVQEQRTRDAIYLLNYNTDAGIYKVHITSIGDVHYSDININKIIEYKVIGSPTAHFNKDTIEQCMSDKLDLQVVINEPLTVDYKLVDGIGNVKEYQVNYTKTSNVELDHTTSGVYKLYMTRIANKFKCSLLTNDVATIMINQSPEIGIISKPDVCANSVISFNIEGINKFEITTQFYPLLLNTDKSTEWGNGASLSTEYITNTFKITENEPLQMLADEPVFLF